MQLVMRPEQFDVMLLENLYGDIVSDLCAGLIGGLGLVPGANIGEKGAMFEAVHGSAPDIAGQGIANPTALLQSGILMLRHLGEREAADRTENAMLKVFEEGKVRTTRHRRHCEDRGVCRCDHSEDERVRATAMMKEARVRIFSLKRLLVSAALGVLLLSGYVFALFLIDLSGKFLLDGDTSPASFMLTILAWPGPLWSLVGGQFDDESMVPGLLFFAFCNIVLYATIIYLALLVISLVRRRLTPPNLPPPQPEQFHFDQSTSGTDAA